MEKTYDPKSIEMKWYEIWEKGGYFAPNEKATKSPYCIMIPPPNVTGSLHMGHAFQDTIMDALIRFHRMQGHKTLWQAGTDHAGIATQMVVERQLQQDNKSRHTLGREAFVNKIWEWKNQSGNIISDQLRRLGASIDWSRERFTMDEGLSKSVQTVFINLYKEGLIYRGQRLVNWDPVLHTAVSDLEVIAEEEQGYLWHIHYPIQNSDDFIEIATTRPETMLGDAAVAVHPDDQRYQHLIGKLICLPLSNREIPIIADTYVEPEFGTGCVKITPAHDFNDYEVGLRHNLDKINILTHDAKINDNAPKVYQGLDRFVARQKIVEDLQNIGLLVKIDNHTLKVPRGDRTQAVIEPYLTDQWFVRVESLVQPAIDVIESGKIEFVPDNWKKTYFEWMRNIKDWCISRQLWWGHRIPAWYDDSGNVYVGESEEIVRQENKISSSITLRQDEDVLDTWFSSALWPFSTLGWPDNTADMQDYYPTNVLVTGFDIIFFWVARMIMFGLKFTGKVPFHKIYIHGLIQDQNGQKMSKSKGNVLDPIDLIDGIELEALINKRTSGLMQPKMASGIVKGTKKQFPNGIPAYGTDALRFTFFSLATHGRHLRFDLARLEGYRNFCNKLWNAARYVLMNIENKSSELPMDLKKFSLPDLWILSRWQKTKLQIINNFNNYRFDLAAQAIYEFTWNEYCDWYLELAKSCAISPVLQHVLEEMLCVIHPIMPFITEEIWQMIVSATSQQATLLIEHSYPAVDEVLVNDEVEATIEWVKTLVVGIRNIRGEMNISPNKKLPILVCGGNAKDKKFLTDNTEFIKTLAKLERVTWLSEEDNKLPISATVLVGDMKILIPMKGLIDKEAEIVRLNKELYKIKKDLCKSKDKLSNPNYRDRAPEEVVVKEENRLAELQVTLNKLESSLESIVSM